MSIVKKTGLYEVLIRFDFMTGSISGAHQKMVEVILEDDQPITAPKELAPTPLDPSAVASVLSDREAAIVNRAIELEHAAIIAEQAKTMAERHAADMERERDNALILATAFRQRLAEASATIERLTEADGK